MTADGRAIYTPFCISSLLAPHFAHHITLLQIWKVTAAGSEGRIGAPSECTDGDLILTAAGERAEALPVKECASACSANGACLAFEHK